MECITVDLYVENREALDAYLLAICKEGYEGVMGVSPDWKWSHHKTSRRINFIKCRYLISRSYI